MQHHKRRPFWWLKTKVHLQKVIVWAPDLTIAQTIYPKTTHSKRTVRVLHYHILHDYQDGTLFDTLIHVTRTYFDSILEIVSPEIENPMDVRQERTASQNNTLNPLQRRFRTEELLFLFLFTLVVTNEGGCGLEHRSYQFHISTASVSNFFLHVVFSVHPSLLAITPALFGWPGEPERRIMEGMRIGFPKCVFLWTGTSQIFGSLGMHTIESGHWWIQKAYFLALLVYFEINGRFTRL